MRLLELDSIINPRDIQPQSDFHLFGVVHHYVTFNLCHKVYVEG